MRAQLGRDRRRRRLLEHLLVAALQRAVALAEVDRGAVAVGQHLDLDVARILDVLLDVDRGVGEVGLALAPRGLERAPGLGRRGDDLHPAPAAAGRGLDRDRPAVAVAELDHGRSADLLGRARHDRHARRRHAPARADLGAHRLDRRGRRADPDQPGRLAGAGERRVLGQEPVARVDRLRPARLRGGDDPLAAEIALGGRARPDQPRLVGAADVQRAAIGLGVDGNRADAELAQRAEDPDGDLAAIRDEHLAKRRSHGRGRVPKAAMSSGAVVVWLVGIGRSALANTGCLLRWCGSVVVEQLVMSRTRNLELRSCPSATGTMWRARSRQGLGGVRCRVRGARPTRDTGRIPQLDGEAAGVTGEAGSVRRSRAEWARLQRGPSEPTLSRGLRLHTAGRAAPGRLRGACGRLSPLQGPAPRPCQRGARSYERTVAPSARVTSALHQLVRRKRIESATIAPPTCR